MSASELQLDTMRRALLDRLKDLRVLEMLLEEPIVSLLDEISRRWNSDGAAGVDG